MKTYSVIELHFESGDVQTLGIALDDIQKVSAIARSVRRAINKENEDKCIFAKIYTKEETAETR
jgi:hypothetical protein